MKQQERTVELPSLPRRWDDMTLAQWKIYYDLAGKYPSDAAFLAKAFLLFCGLKPVLYAERWRWLLSRMPFIRPFVRMTGRQVVGIGDGHIRWKQYYIMGSVRFWMMDEEVMAFQKAIVFLTTAPVVMNNPVSQITIRGRQYQSHKRRLSDMTWASYQTCNAYISSYYQTKNQDSLYLFVGVLYRVPGMDIPYIKKTVSEWQLRLILMFWDGCQKSFADKFKRLFKKNKADNKSKTKDYLADESEITVFIGKESHLSPEGVRQMLTWDALTYLDQHAREVEAKEKQLSKMKKR